ncbi:MAG: GtrA family protein [Chitinophagaceae bacterium]|nr:GtrA family protein [Chitinophagaceae bacterium]MCW5925618.1 GtrA family protein [Chitinophagaceae bacterium]
MKQLVISVLDFFYTPVQKWIDRQTFRYIACGGVNNLMDILLYFIAYNFIFKKEIVHTPLISISPYIAAFIFSFVITFPTGFYLMRNIVFSGSSLKGRVQLFRYFLLVVVCVLMNYVFIKLFVERFEFYPTIAKIITTIIVVSFSYLSQRHFTFKIEKE